MSAVTARVAPSDSAPVSPMKICAGWTLNQRKPSSAPMMSAHRRARLAWLGMLSRAISRYATNAMASVPPGQPVEAVGDVHAVRRRHDRERGEEDVDPGVDRHRADERHRDRGDLVRLLDLVRGHERDDREPDELLAGADALPRPGVEVVVEGAEQPDHRPAPRSGRRSRRPGSARGRSRSRGRRHDQEAAHRRRAFLRVVALRALFADPLAEPDRAEQPDVRRHQDDDEGEREQQPLDQLDGHRARTPFGPRSASDERVEADPARRLDQDHVPVAQPGPEDLERARGIGHDDGSARVRARRPRRAVAMLPTPEPTTTSSRRRPAGGVPDGAVALLVRIAQLEHLARGPRPGARADRRAPRGRPRPSLATRCSCRR